jgi:hypothetical protein
MSTGLSEQQLRLLPEEDACDLVIATEASLPEDDVPDWQTSIMHILLRCVLKYSWNETLDKDSQVGGGGVQSDDACQNAKGEPKGYWHSQLTYKPDDRNALLLSQLSRKTMVKMLTSINISLKGSMHANTAHQLAAIHDPPRTSLVLFLFLCLNGLFLFLSLSVMTM